MPATHERARARIANELPDKHLTEGHTRSPSDDVTNRTTASTEDGRHRWGLQSYDLVHSVVERCLPTQLARLYLCVRRPNDVAADIVECLTGVFLTVQTLASGTQDQDRREAVCTDGLSACSARAVDASCDSCVVTTHARTHANRTELLIEITARTMHSMLFSPDYSARLKTPQDIADYMRTHLLPLAEYLLGNCLTNECKSRSESTARHQVRPR